METTSTKKTKLNHKQKCMAQVISMTKWLAGLLILITIAEAARAQVYISQVMYDPQGTQTGGEFVLLENRGGSSVSVGGWALATGASMKDVVFPAGTTIGAGSMFLVADKGWNESRDNMTWPIADMEDVMTLANINSGVALMVNDTVIDAVGWGNVTNSLLYKGAAADQAPKGHSLRRISYNGSNAVDFASGYPIFDSNATPGGVEITLTVIEPQSPSGLTIHVEDDDSAAGTQLIPFPGMTRKAAINATAIGISIDGVLIKFRGINYTLQKKVGSNNSFNGQIDLPYNTPPGTYPLSADGLLNGEVVSTNLTAVQIQPVVSVTLDSKTIPLGAAVAGSNLIVYGDENISTSDLPTIWNSGNVPAGITMTGSDLKGALSGIPAANIQATLKRSREAVDTIGLRETPQELGVILEAGAMAALDLSIQIPTSRAGNYTGRIWLVATRGE